MKRDKFAVSVQWGGGRVYILQYCATEAEADELAEAEIEQLRKDYKRGAKPVVTVWKLITDRTFL